MRAFLEQYGVGIFVLVLMSILLAFAAPIGSTIKNATNEQIKNVENLTQNYGHGKSKPTEIYSCLYNDGELVLSAHEIKNDENIVNNYWKMADQTKAPWLTDASKIVSVRIEGTVAPTACEKWFYNCANLTTLKNFDYIDVSNVANLSWMFCGCKKLSDIDDLWYWDVSNVHEFGAMFQQTNITNTNALENWNTSKGEWFYGTFYYCKNLSDLSGLRKWNMSNAKYMGSMFYGNSSLTDLSPLSNWKVENVYNFNSMFFHSDNIKNANVLSSWIPQLLKNANINSMFTRNDSSTIPNPFYN